MGDTKGLYLWTSQSYCGCLDANKYTECLNSAPRVLVGPSSPYKVRGSGYSILVAITPRLPLASAIAPGTP